MAECAYCGAFGDRLTGKASKGCRRTTTVFCGGGQVISPRPAPPRAPALRTRLFSKDPRARIPGGDRAVRPFTLVADGASRTPLARRPVGRHRGSLHEPACGLELWHRRERESPAGRRRRLSRCSGAGRQVPPLLAPLPSCRKPVQRQIVRCRTINPGAGFPQPCVALRLKRVACSQARVEAAAWIVGSRIGESRILRRNPRQSTGITWFWDLAAGEGGRPKPLTSTT